MSDVESTKETVEAAAAEAEAEAKSAVSVVPGNSTPETSATKPTSGA